MFGAINKRDYLVGLKDLLMDLYDCPDYFDKDMQTGLNVVENAALSILGVTTPASLGSAISAGDWDNGLLVRFALLMPEPDYAEHPASPVYQTAPAVRAPACAGDDRAGLAHAGCTALERRVLGGVPALWC